MSSSESDNSDISYQSDDSNINFIPEYVIEDAELKQNCQYSISPELEDDGSSALHIRMNPRADEASLEEYSKEQERFATEEKLANRLNGSVDIKEW